MLRFDDLNINLLLEIFNYLSFTDLFHAFYGLQQHLNDAIRDYPACINLSKIIKQHDHQQFPFQCRSLVLSGVDLHSFQTKYSQLNFTPLRSVTLIKMNLITLHSLIEKLPIQQLQSITIGRFIWQYYPVDFYTQVWSSIMNTINANHLRYLKLPYHVRHWNIEKLSVDFTALRYATLEFISVRQMLTFMNHTPNLRRFKACLAAPHKDLFRYTIVLSNLNRLILNLQDEWLLDEIQRLFTICPYLKHLFLKLEARKETKIIFEPTTWQMLIEENLTYLIFLRLRLNCIIVYPDLKGCNYQENFNHTEYWFQRRPNFQVAVKEIQRKVL